jgi:hypothetical protein
LKTLPLPETTTTTTTTNNNSNLMKTRKTKQTQPTGAQRKEAKPTGCGALSQSKLTKKTHI